MLKDKGRLNWPAALTGSVFQRPRDRLAMNAVEVVRQASRDHRVDFVVLRQMADDMNELRMLLRQNRDFSFQAFIDARDFLQRFDDALVALRQPEATNYFDGTYDLKAQTVLGLVKQMTDAGLRFAPAAPGDEAAYAALRETMAACDRATAKHVAAR
jgi:hypothetical protein